MLFDIFQQVSSLSFAANVVNKAMADQASLQQRLQGTLTSEIPKIGADWQLVWGPVVFKTKPEDAQSGPENSWYVAFHPHLRFEDDSVHPTYVIAIAGTPEESKRVWWEQNLSVHAVANFKAWVDGGIQNPPEEVQRKDVKWIQKGTYIASGTVKAVHRLLTTPAPEGAASAEWTLLNYITKQGKSTSHRIIVTGYSLGGALSPTLALALLMGGLVPADCILSYPIAGPSPGNKRFVELFVKNMPARKSDGAASYQGWNLNLVNQLDVVPQAWCISSWISKNQNLGNIPTLYGKPAISIIKNGVSAFKFWSMFSGVLYKPLPAQYFKGTTPARVPTDMDKFKEIALLQHYEPYFEEVKIPLPPPEMRQAFSSAIDQVIPGGE